MATSDDESDVQQEYYDKEVNERDILDIRLDDQSANRGLRDDGSSVADEEKFYTDGCGCKKECTTKFPKNEVIDSRLSCQEMRYYCDNHVNHHHLYLLGKFL